MNCLFKVRRKSTGEIVPVYAVKSNDIPYFLVYFRIFNSTEGEWLYVSSRRFEPIEEGGKE